MSTTSFGSNGHAAQTLPGLEANGNSLQVYYEKAKKVSIHEVVEGVKELKKQYPEFEITFDMKLKNI